MNMKDKVITYSVVDDKNRLMIPQEIIAAYNDFWIIPWVNKKLYLSSKEKVAEIENYLKENSIDIRVLLAIRRIMGRVIHLEMDSKNRMVLPVYICQYADIKKGSRICFVREEDHIELFVEK